MGVALRNRTKVFLWCYIDLDEWGGVNSSWRQVRVQRSKLPELRREREIVSNEEVRERDWWREFKGEAYVDEKRGAVSKSPKIGDVVLLRAEKNNKLPSFFHHGPVKAVHKMESESTVRNDSGVELRRNSALFNNCHTLGRFQKLGRKRRKWKSSRRRWERTWERHIGRGSKHGKWTSRCWL